MKPPRYAKSKIKKLLWTYAYPLVEANSNSIIYSHNLVGSLIDVRQGKVRYVTAKYTGKPIYLVENKNKIRNR